jgi:hypothetical protein
MLTNLFYAFHFTADNFCENSMPTKTIIAPLTPLVHHGTTGSSV